MRSLLATERKRCVCLSLGGKSFWERVSLWCQEASLFRPIFLPVRSLLGNCYFCIYLFFSCYCLFFISFEVLQALGSVEFLFIAIIPKTTLTQSGSTCLSPINGSNKPFQKLLVLDRSTWNQAIKWLLLNKNSYLKPYYCLDYYLYRNSWKSSYGYHIYPTPPLGQDMTQGQFLSGV